MIDEEPIPKEILDYYRFLRRLYELAGEKRLIWDDFFLEKKEGEID